MKMNEVLSTMILYTDDDCRVGIVLKGKYALFDNEEEEKAYTGWRGDYACYLAAIKLPAQPESVFPVALDHGTKMPRAVAMAFFGGAVELLESHGAKYRQ